jgi:hypothetical protein
VELLTDITKGTGQMAYTWHLPMKQ